MDCPQIDYRVLFRYTFVELPDVAILMRARSCREDHYLGALQRVAVAIGPGRYATEPDATGGRKTIAIRIDRYIG